MPLRKRKCGGRNKLQGRMAVSQTGFQNRLQGLSLLYSLLAGNLNFVHVAVIEKGLLLRAMPRATADSLERSGNLCNSLNQNVFG
jgi:hypothetical protein